jgi:hypothetical protein
MLQKAKSIIETSFLSQAAPLKSAAASAQPKKQDKFQDDTDEQNPHLRIAKIAYFQQRPRAVTPVPIQQQVFQLQVPVSNPLASTTAPGGQEEAGEAAGQPNKNVRKARKHLCMAIVQTNDELLKYPTGLGLLQPAVRLVSANVFEHVTALCIFHRNS